MTALAHDRSRSAQTDPAPPRVNRTVATARSLLTTMLGEFVKPGVPVWTMTFIGAMRVFGIEEPASRQALTRSVTAGLLVPERVGRRTRWGLSPAGADLLRRGAARIYGFLRESSPWDGRWLLLSVTVPETERALRHKLRARLSWAGLGSPLPGLWVVPDASRADEVRDVIDDLGLTARTMSWVAESADVGGVEQLVASAWRLDELRAGYRAFQEDYSCRDVADGEGAFVAQLQLLGAWRRFPFLDPRLPAELLEPDWPGPLAAAEFHRCNERWSRRALGYWQSLCEAAEESG